MLKTLLLFLALSPLFAFDQPSEMTLSSQTKIGNLTLEAGTYQVKLKGSIVFFTDSSKKSLSTFAKIEKLPKPSGGTAVLGENVGGAYRIMSITLTGADYRLVF
jgi:hypothetical protein